MARKKYEELTFSDDFMFCKVLQDNPELCRELLELILGRPVGKLVDTEGQKSIKLTPDGKGVRFDVYAADDQSVVYDVEMQNALRDNLPKRTRYAQSMIDSKTLQKGKRYSELCSSYVIYICQFNLWNESGRHKYSFRNLCVEDPEVELGDETEKIFLCTKGTADDISPEMEQFLAFVAGSTPEGDFTNRLSDAVDRVRMDPGWRQQYMDMQDYLDIAKEEGRAEERLNTEREKKRADQAESRADAAESRADAAESRADRETKRADAAEAELARLRELLAGKTAE